MDSNRKSIDFQWLFPDYEVTVLPTGTVDWVQKGASSISNPDIIILHVGTNDLDNGASSQDCAQKLLVRQQNCKRITPTRL